MSCCKKVIHRYSTTNRGVFCLNWVLPLRILAVASLAFHLLYKTLYEPSTYAGILTVGHVFFALVLLAECRRSVRYHQSLRELEILGERRRVLRQK